MGRYIRYWYTYRTVVAVLLALLISGLMFWLYTQQLACDTHLGNCVVNISLHPEDRFMGGSDVGSTVEIVGIDDRSVQALGTYPLPRHYYADALRNLEKAGAAVVAFDVNFTDPTLADQDFVDALKTSTIPVVLSYGGENAIAGAGMIIQTGPSTNPIGIDQIPQRRFWCADAGPNLTGPCQHPFPNVILASTDLRADPDGVVRRTPLFVQPACFTTGACDTRIINPLSFAAVRAWEVSPGATGPTLHGPAGPTLRLSRGGAMFYREDGPVIWTQPLPVDSTGSALINFTGAAGNFKANGQYISFSEVVKGNIPPSAVTYHSSGSDKPQAKIVIVGAYNLTGFHDEQLVTTSAGSGGTPMAGVEIHANLVQMFLDANPSSTNPLRTVFGTIRLPGRVSSFLTTEPPLGIFLSILLLALLMALAVARVSVLKGLLASVAALVVFTYAMSVLAAFQNFVPDLFHPWLAIALTYTGVTAYRFLYEDREKRKVTAIFGHYLKPEIVAQLAKTRGGVDDILRGGERRDITLLFVDVRGFTSMSERMDADEVVSVVQMYLDHLSGIIFHWDGTVDKYVGDEIVAFWNAPRLQGNHALLAVRCAYDLINRAPELQARLLEKGLPPIRWGIGVNTGPAVVGNMGSRSRLQYTALGDTVNTAARFCANAPAYHLLIGQPTYDLCKDYIAVEMVPGVQLKGKSAETFRIYQVTAIRETPTSPWVPFPTEMALQAQDAFTQQYKDKTILGNVNSTSRDILVGDAAQQALDDQAAVAATPPYGTPAYGTPIQSPGESPTPAEP